jgi:hypothetical protein
VEVIEQLSTVLRIVGFGALVLGVSMFVLTGCGTSGAMPANIRAGHRVFVNTGHRPDDVCRKNHAAGNQTLVSSRATTAGAALDRYRQDHASTNQMLAGLPRGAFIALCTYKLTNPARQVVTAVDAHGNSTWVA